MNTVDSYVKKMMTDSTIENSLKKKSSSDLFNMTSAKKNISSFQAVKYLTRLAGAKTQQQVYSVISSLRRELVKAKNCDDYAAVLKSIQKIKGKAEEKIVKLATEKAIEKKRKEAEQQHKIEERKRQEKILRTKQMSRKEQENFDLYEGAVDDSNLFRNGYDNMLNRNMDNENAIGSNIDEVTTDGEDGETSSAVDIII